MNRNSLRVPLIKSATMLAVISLLVYLTATSAEGTIWSSLGTLFVGIFRIVQLGLGLVLSLLFCLIVLSAIFLAGVAMVSRENAVAMLEQMRQKISDQLLFVRSLVIRDAPSSDTHPQQASDPVGKKELLAGMEESLEPVRRDQALATGRLEELEQRLERIESGGDIASLSLRLNQLEERVRELAGMNEEIQGRIASIWEGLDGRIAGELDQRFDPARTELAARMGDIEKTMETLQEDLEHLVEGAAAGYAKSESGGKAGGEPVEHRLFAHLESRELQEKVARLVTETLESDMSYAQVVDHLVARCGGKAAAVISAHPSLAKDYIRYRRQNG